MSTCGKRIKARRMELGLSASELAEKIGKNRATIYRYESDDIENMPANVLEPIAKALGVTPSYLLGIDNIYPVDKGTHRIPLLGKIACGEPITAIENIEDYVDVPDFIHADFALVCQGDSMQNARIYDGDIVYIRKQPTIENGEISAVLIDDEATLKRVYLHRNMVILQAENPNYPPLSYKAEDVKILGKATHFISKVK